MIEWVLFGMIVILQALDVISTKKALDRPGNYEENKFVKKTMDLLGVLNALLLIKFAFCFFLLFAVYYVKDDILIAVLGVIVGFYIPIVRENFRISREDQ